jgi:hypothetical protein
MKARNFLAGSLLAALTVFYDSSYREGYRDGRAAERRRVEPRPGRYSDRGYWRYR